MTMSKLFKIWAVAIVTCGLGAAWAQDIPVAAGQPAAQGPAPAYGQDNTPASVSENPPISGIDLPSLEPNAAPLSFLQPGATVSETGNSNIAETGGGGAKFTSVTSALGSVQLRRLWSHYDLGLDYLGGAAYYSARGQGWKLLQNINVDQKITWRRGALSLRDSFSYLPQGNFGGAYGSQGSLVSPSLGNPAFGAFFGGMQTGAFGLAPRIVNVALADVTESLTPRSTVTGAASYAFTHFYGNDFSSGTPFLGETQISAQAGYNHTVSAHTQIALSYGYQNFDYSVSGLSFHSHVLQGMYGHRVTGRMDFLIAAGPQLTMIDSRSAVCSDPTLPPDVLCQLFGQTLLPVINKTTKLGVAGQAHLRYKFPRTSLDLKYQRYETGGSGLFAGAQSDIVSLDVNRPLTRVWNAFFDIGYSRNSRLQSLTATQLTTCVYAGQFNPLGLPSCPGIDAKRYQYGFLGGGLHRRIGHDFHFFMSYQFNELSFDNSYCAGLAACNRIANTNLVTVGLDWTPRPMRLD